MRAYPGPRLVCQTVISCCIHQAKFVEDCHDSAEALHSVSGNGNGNGNASDLVSKSASNNGLSIVQAIHIWTGSQPRPYAPWYLGT